MKHEMVGKMKVLVGVLVLALGVPQGAIAQDAGATNPDHSQATGTGAPSSASPTRPGSGNAESNRLQAVEGLISALTENNDKEIKSSAVSLKGTPEDVTISSENLKKLAKYSSEGYKQILSEIDACTTKEKDPVSGQLSALMEQYSKKLRWALFEKPSTVIGGKPELRVADAKTLTALTVQIEKLLKKRGELMPSDAHKPFATETEKKIAGWLDTTLTMFFGGDAAKHKTDFEALGSSGLLAPLAWLTISPEIKASIAATEKAIKESEKAATADLCKLGGAPAASSTSAVAQTSVQTSTGNPVSSQAIPLVEDPAAGGNEGAGAGVGSDTGAGSTAAAASPDFQTALAQFQAQNDRRLLELQQFAQQAIDGKERQNLQEQLEFQRQLQDNENKAQEQLLRLAAQAQQNDQVIPPPAPPSTPVITPPPPPPTFDSGDQGFDPLAAQANQPLPNQGGMMMPPYYPPPQAVAPVIYPPQQSQFANQEEYVPRSSLLTQNGLLGVNPQLAGQAAVNQLLASVRPQFGFGAMGAQQNGLYGQQGLYGNQMGGAAPNSMTLRLSGFASTRRNQVSATGANNALMSATSGPANLGTTPLGRSSTVPSDLRGSLGGRI
jgi:hypothetical protein